jgi:hypothetical protein
LLEHGFTIVDASPAIQERFGLPRRDAPEDVRLFDRWDRQGISVEGGQERATEVVRELQNALPHALFSPSTSDAQCPQDREGPRLAPRRALWVRYVAEFPATVKDQLDRLRSRIVPTIPGHHALKIVDPVAVDIAEATLAADASQEAALGQRLREELVYRHFQPGMDVLVRHIKAGQSPIELWGQLQQWQAGALLLVRHFHGGGTYDGLGLPKEEGDWGTLLIREGAWVTVRRYFRQEGALVGELYNIGTPAEFYPDHLRYVDLELDVVRLPDGSSRLEDEGVLADRLARGLLPLALCQEAFRIGVGLLHQFATAADTQDRPKP